MESDVELMMRAKSGDDSAFTDLMKRHYKGLVNYIYRFTNNRESSEDLAQEVFLRVYRSASRYKPDAKFSTWLYKIATNLCLTNFKTKRKEQNLSLDEMEENAGGFEDSKSENADNVVYRGEIKDAIFRALETLPEKERVSIILCKYEEIPYDEVAEVLGCTVGAVKTHVYRGRMKLVEKLRPYLKREGNYEL